MVIVQVRHEVVIECHSGGCGFRHIVDIQKTSNPDYASTIAEGVDVAVFLANNHVRSGHECFRLQVARRTIVPGDPPQMTWVADLSYHGQPSLFLPWFEAGVSFGGRAGSDSP